MGNQTIESLPYDVLMIITEYLNIDDYWSLQLSSIHFNLPSKPSLCWNNYMNSVDIVNPSNLPNFVYSNYFTPKLDVFKDFKLQTLLFHRQYTILEYLLDKNKLTIEFKQLLFEQTILEQNDLCFRLLEDKDIDLNNELIPLQNASKVGNLKILKEILTRTNIDPSTDSNIIVNNIVLNGHLDCLKYLLHDDRISFSNTLLLATKYCQIELVKLLLTLPIVDLHNAILISCHYEFNQITELLLLDDRTNIDFGVEKSLLYEFDNILLYYLTHRIIDISLSWIEKLWIYCCSNGLYTHIKLLLCHDELDPTIKSNRGIRLTSSRQHHECMKLLLQNENIFNHDHGSLIQIAIKDGLPMLLEAILDDDRLQQKRLTINLFKLSIQLNHLDCFKILLNE
ncbi:hypothetical protein BC833DRAFT_35359 [Globomyces pollinis-pini]|nr:hypothetical protein BC833DRAFT_35359 [Globomyces pollinis-pini]